jgi:rRNA maturation endonuclease Nob1
MAQIGVKYRCEKCDKWYKSDASHIGEYPDECEHCGSEDIWFGEVIRDGEDEKEIELGKRRSGNCFTANWD